ncbi:MAG: GyrI-like domain-containing protein [Candidatus Edwardsbacteria bacterium]
MLRDNKSTALVVALLLLGLVCFGCAKKEEKPVVQAPPPPPEVVIKTVTPLTAACLSKVGPYSETGKSLGELFGWLAKKKLTIEGPPMGIYYDDPKTVAPEKTRYEVCLPITPGTKGDKNVKVKELPGGEMAVIMHHGPYGQCGGAYEKICKWIAESGYEIIGAAREIYLNDPGKVPPDSLLTEIQFPVKKKM